MNNKCIFFEQPLRRAPSSAPSRAFFLRVLPPTIFNWIENGSSCICCCHRQTIQWAVPPLDATPAVRFKLLLSQLVGGMHTEKSIRAIQADLLEISPEGRRTTEDKTFISDLRNSSCKLYVSETTKLNSSYQICCFRYGDMKISLYKFLKSAILFFFQSFLRMVENGILFIWIYF